MSTIFRLAIPLLFLLVGQACSTSGGNSSGSGDSSSTLDGQPTSSAGAPPPSDGDLIPAVVGIPPDPGAASTYRIGPHDLLKIEVFQVEDLSGETRVDDKGFVTMPLIGEIGVGGLTPGEAEDALEAALGRDYLQDPQVNIFVSEYASQDVTVTGSVKKSGVYPLKGRTTLLQALALAGGFDNVANEEQVLVFRGQAGGATKAYVVNVEAIQDGSLADPVLAANDRVVVPKSGVSVFLRGAGNIVSGWLLRAPIY